MKHKIQLHSITVKNLSAYGRRKHPIKKNPKPYEKHTYSRKAKSENPSPYYRRAIRQSFISIAIVICVLAMSSLDYKIFNDATRGIEYLVNHKFSFSQVFSVFNLDNANPSSSAIPVASEKDPILSSPTTGQALSDLVDNTNTPVGLIYSVPDGLCYSACDGVVFYVDKVSVDNPYIRIRHDNSLDTLYMGIIASVELGDDIAQGQVIGTSVGANMGFVLLKNSKYTDIAPYMTTSP